MQCPECDKLIRPDAFRCSCGFVVPTPSGSAPTRAHVDCVYTICREPAECRVFTRTGWVNVCLRHYPDIEQAPRVTDNAHVAKVREAYARSVAKASRKGMKAFVPRGYNRAKQPEDVEVKI